MVTAAHCVVFDDKLVPTEQVTVVLGDYDIKNYDETEMELNVKEIFPHVDYHSYDNHDDIALIKLEVEVNLNIYTHICLPKAGVDFTDKTALAYGNKYGIILNI